MQIMLVHLECGNILNFPDFFKLNCFLVLVEADLVFFPPSSPKTVKADHAIEVSKLRKTLPQVVFETSPVSEGVLTWEMTFTCHFRDFY